MNSDIANFLRSNIQYVAVGQGESLYTKFVEEFPMYSVSYLTDTMMEVFTSDQILSLFKNTLPESAFRFIEVDSIYVPDNIQSIGDYAFMDCTNLKRISLPAAVKFGKHVCDDCQTLEYAEIRKGAGGCGFRTFATCDRLTHVKVDSSVINESAFTGATRLSNVEIGTNVRQIENTVFTNCIRLYQIDYLGTKEQWNNIIKYGWWKKHSPIKKLVCTDGEFDI